MACPAVTTGQGFLTETLSHLDCQAQIVGSYGFQSLANSGSPASSLLTALLTLFVALFGIRLLFGRRVGPGDAVGAVLKIGIVLTLALSWPAFRTLAYDTVLHGPAQLGATIGGDALPELGDGLAGRLQQVDDGIIALTQVGSGRQVGSLDVPGEQPGSFQGIALQDESALGYGRTIFLGATIGMLGALRIAAALLLALTPVIAGLLLFDVTRGIFAGWLRGLVLTALGSLGISLLLAIEVAVMEPWLEDALNRRTLGYATPGAPTELLALSLGFALAGFTLLAVLTRVAFQNSWPMASWLQPAVHAEPVPTERTVPAVLDRSSDLPVHSRAVAVSEAMMATIRREERFDDRREGRRLSEVAVRGGGPVTATAGGAGGAQALGSSYRRNSRRASGAHQRRNDTR
ncbi:MAG: type IV secretion system protein [Candidatus Andeanibacterium colombiense]|uniref:Type IV secretion system protein n=1 Tax=Candidatus Andeanibacterium colombiense TaxID=3121345 RepID=A0AAJ6BNU5_9SPHN|nr:MAG: type IV secretion system protein [Sphingomonadaceae bacterium]